MITVEQEQKIVLLASEIAKAILPIDEILQQLNISENEWEFLSNTKVFKDILDSSSAEWHSATNTHKRAKLKAAAVIETVLPTFYNDMIDAKQKLADRAKVLETVAKIAGLGTPDPTAAPSGNVFRLQINMADSKQINLSMSKQTYSESNTIEGETFDEFTKSETLENTLKISPVFADEDIDETEDL